ncbi:MULTISPECIES: acyl-CoA dehydrogenase family protein [unclassified Saccharopolyspora]|uniref:acyl-CoA dehydrogenase family protein n=1 Tax=unclassified Saccharopolyspora TaxID=2646250 RepID=UPI001CD62DC5|nr:MULTISPECIES: acyl-CoA dehydrogenase family protein [unclassified Saccharopolyspora]MCA1193749.1 acyl-CoA/acyl-ACP dehydrogenase [Saccharopolyspora sp. 6V]MCA1280411.1 acyl-CoA/acyl-ACP dehydrogenase [Saccharopolyspora sp. 7B]
MDFALDDTHQPLRELANDVLVRERDRSRNAPDGDGSGTGSRTWKALAAAGLLSLAVPERLGGAGLGPLATAVLLAEIGRHAAPVPALATTAFGVLPVARHGTPVQQDRLLGEVGSGQVLTAALGEPSAPLTPAPRTSARPDGAELVVTGTKTDVPAAAAAREILVPVTVEGGGTAVALLRPDAPGVELEPTSTSGGTAWTARFAQARGERLGGADALPDLLRCARAGICALGDGALAGALALTTEHVRTRTQFGRPLAAFQAVAWQIADVHIAARTLHLAVLAACWRLDERRPAEEDLAVAALWLTEQAPAALHTCHHLHGGIGLDVTYPLHRHHSLVKDLTRLLGGPGSAVDARADRLARR